MLLRVLQDEQLLVLLETTLTALSTNVWCRRLQLFSLRIPRNQLMTDTKRVPITIARVMLVIAKH